MKYLRRIIIPVVILIIVKLLFWSAFFAGLEQKAQDSLFRIRGKQPVSGDIVIVAIDDVTFQALDRPWPFPRDMHARLIDNLTKAGARQIVFDIEFTENSSPLPDHILAAQAATTRNVIFAGKHIVDPDNPSLVQVQQPITPIMAEKLPWGIVNMPQERDGVIRKYDLFERFDKQNIYSLDVVSLANNRVYQSDWQKTVTLSKDQLTAADFHIPVINGHKALINYYGPAGTFKTVSYASVIDDSATTMPGYQGVELDEYYGLRDSGVFKDKIVLVGATIAELHDNFTTPFSSSLTPGVEIRANFQEMVRHHNYIHYLNGWLFLLIELLLVAGLALVYTIMRPTWSGIMTLVLIALTVFIGIQAFMRLHTLIPMVELIVLLILLYVATLVQHYIITLKEKKFIRGAFAQYLSPELVNVLLKHPDNLKYGGAMQEVTVLFSDIVSFTTYSEKHTPQQTVSILQEYLTAMVEVIKHNNGILDKFVGDEIMALYSVPVNSEKHALEACQTALQMRDRLTELQAKWKKEGIQPFDMGIGINTGMAVVGNLGSEQIFDYTAIGDTINLGARLESITRDYETKKKIIISEFTYAKVEDKVEVRYLDEVKVKGKDDAVKIYELIDIKKQ